MCASTCMLFNWCIFFALWYSYSYSNILYLCQSKDRELFFTGCTPNFDNDQAEVVLGKALHTLIYLRNSFGKVLKHIAKCTCICQYGTWNVEMLAEIFPLWKIINTPKKTKENECAWQQNICYQFYTGWINIRQNFVHILCHDLFFSKFIVLPLAKAWL